MISTSKVNHGNNYTLGSNQEEQERLALQGILYNDTHYLNLTGNEIVCEIGCGSGANLDIAEKLKKGRFIGVDIQKIQIETAKKLAAKKKLNNTTFYLEDGINIPLDDNIVDVAFCRLVLIHQPLISSQGQPKYKSILAEMDRITRISGQVIAIEPNVHSYISSKPYLNKCFKARCEYAYQPDKGTINIVKLLPSTFYEMYGKGNVEIIDHEINISANKNGKQQLKLFYKNWLIMINSVKDMLLEKDLITVDDFETAKLEMETIEENDYLNQHLLIIKGKKS